MSSLPSSLRSSLLTSLYTHEAKGCKLTRSDYFHVMSAAWRLLYSPDWQDVTVPDLQLLVQTRSDIKTDSPSAVEDLQRVLSRLGIVPSTVDCSPVSAGRDPAAHMSHTDIYSSIFDILLSFSTSSTQVFRLTAYSTKNVYSFREKQLVYGLIPQLSSVQVMDLGHAVDDNILQQVGRSCSCMRKLSIAGSAISDSGLEVFCEEGERSGLTKSLTSLTLHSTALVTLPGILRALDSLQHLAELSLQDNLLLQILRTAEAGQSQVPVRQLELTLGPGRRDYLGPASSFLPLLTQLTLWCFESENVSSLSGFTAWTQFDKLSSLVLNNVANCDLLQIIQAVGHQLRNIEIDNFSNDESDLQIYLDLYQIGIFCQNIQNLSVAMAFVDFTPNKKVSQAIFQHLTSLHLKSNKYGSKNVLSNLLHQAQNLVKLSVQLKAVRTAEVEFEVLSDRVMVELLSNNALQRLEEVSLNTMDHPHGIGCSLNLTEVTLTHLLSHCQRLQLIGDLSRWSFEDIEQTMNMLSRQWAWTTYT